MSIKSVMPSNHLILCHPLLPSSFFPSIRVFANKSVLHQVAKVLEFQLQYQSFQWSWSPLGWTGWISLKSKGLSRVFSSTIVQKHQFFSTEVSDFILFGSKITADGDCSHEIKRHLLLGRKAMTHLDRILKSRDITLSTKVHLVEAMVFPVVMCGCESWVLKNWGFWTIVLEKTLWSPLDCKEIEPVNPEGNQSWIFLGRTDAEADTPILWPLDAKSWLTWKDPNAGKDRRQEEEPTEDEMVGWHYWLNGHEFE